MHRVEVGHRFHMRRGGVGALTRLPPIWHSLYAAAGLGAVMGQQFRLPLGELGKTLTNVWAICAWYCCRVPLSNN